MKLLTICGVIALMTLPAHCAQVKCKCPVLSAEHAKEIYSGGHTYDTYNGYMVYSSRNVTQELIKAIDKVDSQRPIINKEDDCVCQYLVVNKSGRVIDELGLELVTGETMAQAEEGLKDSTS